MATRKTTELVAVKMGSGRPGPDLTALSKKIGEDFEQWKMARRDAAYRGIRIGILLGHAKAQLPHGEFLPWLSKNHGDMTARNAQLFMRDASLAVQDKTLQGLETLLLGDGSKKDMAKADAALLKFIDGRTQAELRADLSGKKQDQRRDAQQREQFDLKTECLVNLRSSCEQILQISNVLDRERHDTACARLLKTLEEMTGTAWSPDPERKRDQEQFHEHGHVYET